MHFSDPRLDWYIVYHKVANIALISSLTNGTTLFTMVTMSKDKTFAQELIDIIMEQRKFMNELANMIVKQNKEIGYMIDKITNQTKSL